jgi:hypothetical protein
MPVDDHPRGDATRRPNKRARHHVEDLIKKILFTFLTGQHPEHPPTQQGHERDLSDELDNDKGSEHVPGKSRNCTVEISTYPRLTQADAAGLNKG